MAHADKPAGAPAPWPGRHAAVHSPGAGPHLPCRYMEAGSPGDLTGALEAACRGGGDAKARFWELGQAELRRIAAAKLAEWHGRVSLSPTEVLHEAFLRMVDRSRVTTEGAAYFYCSFATECRRLLIDHYRKGRADRRGGDRRRVTLHSEVLDPTHPEIDLIDLHDAIETLAGLDPRQAAIVDMRMFGDMTVAQCAEMLQVSERTVADDWRHARSWLQVRLAR